MFSDASVALSFSFLNSSLKNLASRSIFNVQIAVRLQPISFAVKLQLT